MKKRGGEEARKRGSSEKKPGTKRIEVEIEEAVYKKLHGELGLKIAMGNFHGLQDEFTRIIVSTIEKGDDFVGILMNDVEKDARKGPKR